MKIDIQDDNSTLIKKASYLAVIAASLIILAKLAGWFMTGSLSILASLFDSTLDIVASLVNLVAIHYALQPADNEHRFGHNKAEDLAVLTQSLFFFVSGIAVIIIALKKVIYPEQLERGAVGIYLMVFSILVTTLLVIFQRFVIAKTKSTIIEADNFHYFIDLLTNLATIIALFLTTYFHWYIVDPIFAIAIAVYIIYGASRLLKRSFNNLMDKELDNGEKDLIKQVILENPKVKSFHDLKTRYAGNKPFIQFHIVLDGKMTLNEVHTITEEIENKILRSMPNAEIIIHQDPDGLDEEISYKD